jgi:Ni,Fe-hydrogenase III small subunit
MFDTLKSRIYQGQQFIKDIENAPMRAQFRGFPVLNSEAEVSDLKDVCPTGALSLSPLAIDMGKCTFCEACSRCETGEKCNNAVQFTNGYKLASTSREALIVTPKIKYEHYVETAIEARKEIKKIFGHSLKLRQVSAGGCNGCEMELGACSNVNFDMGRFGIDFVASPRHADGIVITGPISENMAYALENCYNSVPDPKIVILCGACAISGGVFQESTKLNRKFLAKYPIDLYIPGCPVHPLTFINAVLKFSGRAKV